MKRFRRWCGGGVVGLAIVLLVTFFFSPFTPGGFVEGGKVEDGRYFVVSKGHRYTEVSETQWRIAQYVECTFPWLPVMLIWLGVGLRVAPATARAGPPATGQQRGFGAVDRLRRRGGDGRFGGGKVLQHRGSVGDWDWRLARAVGRYLCSRLAGLPPHAHN